MVRKKKMPPGGFVSASETSQIYSTRPAAALAVLALYSFVTIDLCQGLKRVSLPSLAQQLTVIIAI